jgi:hypothetical protein
MSLACLSEADQAKALSNYDKMQEKKLASGNAVNEFVDKANHRYYFNTIGKSFYQQRLCFRVAT